MNVKILFSDIILLAMLGTIISLCIIVKQQDKDIRKLTDALIKLDNGLELFSHEYRNDLRGR